MAKQSYRISAEIKEEIIKKIKHEGLSVIDTAKQYGISDKTIYNWLGTRAKVQCVSLNTTSDGVLS